jgi:hypothetical protein
MRGVFVSGGEMIDTTTVRLSKHFLLSDFMGCNSVYTKGYANVFNDPYGAKLKEAQALCENALEPLLEEYSRLSISYGYLSPELSRLTVKYQDPDKPSYHRWDDGAACDVVLHDCIADGEAPIESAFWMDMNLPVSRVITYSESPFICVATRVNELRRGEPRRALYENRYIGERKPQYIPYSNSPASRIEQKKEARAYIAKAGDGWKGAGYPTYHGGGIRQAQHIRTSRFTVLSDFLFSDHAVQHGIPNHPGIRDIAPFRRAGRIYDAILVTLKIRRLSIVRAYENPVWGDHPYTWETDIMLQVVPPEGVSPDDVADAAMSMEEVHTVGVHEDLVTIGAYRAPKRM